MTGNSAGVSFLFMERKHIPLARIILAVIVLLVTVFLIVGIVLWTQSIARQNRVEELKAELERVSQENGQMALLAALGLQVDNIFYGDDGLLLFDEGLARWNYSADEYQNITVYRRVAPSVVSIISHSGLSETSSGSGVIISSDGYVITNRHVIGSGTAFEVSLYDGSAVSASLIGYDSITDIAVIKLEGGSKYVPVEFNTDDNVTVGQKVIAIGSPYGYDWSQSVGSVSGLGRVVASSDGIPLANMIQTDASINPGNSGGPLLDSHGRMIGLNTAIYSTSGSSQGISFAIPVETVLSVAADLIRSGSVNRGWLDILSVELNPLIADYAGLPISKGVLISQVVPAGPADRAGLRGGSEMVQYGSSVIYLGGDIITKIGETVVDGYNDYFTALLQTREGDKVDVEVFRNGSYVTVRGVELVRQNTENTSWIIR